jgi:hypothetical protein
MVALIVFNVPPRHGPRRKHSPIFDEACLLRRCNGKLFDCCLSIRCRGSVFTELLSRNERLFRLHYSDFRASYHSIYVFIREGLTIAHVTLLLLEQLRNKNSDHNQFNKGWEIEVYMFSTSIIDVVISKRVQYKYSPPRQRDFTLSALKYPNQYIRQLCIF